MAARCWVCFKLLGLNSWRCDTCGAGSCHAHDGAPMGVLGAIAPGGICGMCGSPCTSAMHYFMHAEKVFD